jgi:hypothetical protein
MKLIWKRIEKTNSRSIYVIAQPMTPVVFAPRTGGLRDTDMDPIQNWCVENKCGVRTSFDTFKFRNEDELTFFLLKWS